MEKMVKICPICGHSNPADSIYCENDPCEYDLSSVAASPESQAAPAAPAAPVSAPAPEPMRPQTPPFGRSVSPAPVRPQTPASAGVSRPAAQMGRQCRKCPTISPLNVMVCPTCGSSLATADVVTQANAPSPAPAQEAGFCSYMIVSSDNQASLSITEGQHLLIGWAGELGSYLERSRKDYVSNRHGTLSVIRGELFFEDSSSNGTLINDHSIPRGQAQKLSEGDILCLGGRPGIQMAAAAYFRIEKR